MVAIHGIKSVYSEDGGIMDITAIEVNFLYTFCIQ